MSDAKLKKKVQLKQKTEEPVVQLKRKGDDAVTAVHLKKKTDSEAAVAATIAATTAAEAASATMAKEATVAQAQSDQASTSVTPVPAANANSSKIAPESAPSREKSSSSNSSTAATGNGGKVVGWIIGAVVFAGLVFGGYKLIDGNSGNKPPLIVTSDEAGARSADANSIDSQESRKDVENAAENSNDSTVAKNTSDSASGADGTAGSAANVASNSTSNATGTQGESEGSQSTSTHGPNSSANTSGTSENSFANQNTSNATEGSAQSVDDNAQLAAGKSTSGKATTATGNVGGKAPSATTDVKVESHVPAFTVNRVSDSNAVCLFEFDSSVVTENQTLNDIAEIAKNSGKTVNISGFTDRVGSHDYNQWLSNRRANAIKTYLVKRGVSSEKIKANGCGISNTYPTNAKNRRADITLE